MSSYRQLILLIGSTALMAALAACGGRNSQSAAMAVSPDSMSVRPQATRAELESALARVQQSNPRSRTVSMISRRLEQGDLLSGDRIFLQVMGEDALTDTFTVRPAQTLLLPNIPEFSVKGVLRSELDSVLTQRIAQYLRNPDVEAVALMRVAVLGSVNKPGFYTVPAALLASDVVMTAGGPTGAADFDRTEIRRGDSVLVQPQETAAAFNQGVSLDAMNLQSGDQIVVGTQGGGWKTILPIIGAVSGLAWGISRIF